MMSLAEARRKYSDRPGETVIVSHNEYQDLRELVHRLALQMRRWNGQLFGKRFVVRHGGRA